MKITIKEFKTLIGESKNNYADIQLKEIINTFEIISDLIIDVNIQNQFKVKNKN